MHTDRQGETPQFNPRRSQSGENSESRAVHAPVSSDLPPTLRRDHEDCLGLIDRLLLNDEADDRGALWEELSLDLRAHAVAARETVYRQLARARTLRGRTARAIAEHDEIGQLLEEMHDLDSCGARFLARLAKLRYTVSKHAESEATALLPLAERQFDVTALDQMAEDFLVRKMDILDDLRSETSFG
jgi:hypothetical protein